MAVPTVKTTYSLDVETIRTLDRIARRWGVSKSEALRRAIRGAAKTTGLDDRLQALDELQNSLDLARARADTWVEAVRAERRITPRRRTRRAR